MLESTLCTHQGNWSHLTPLINLQYKKRNNKKVGWSIGWLVKFWPSLSYGKNKTNIKKKNNFSSFLVNFSLNHTYDVTKLYMSSKPLGILFPLFYINYALQKAYLTWLKYYWLRKVLYRVSCHINCSGS